jgi:hypothetical protein
MISMRNGKLSGTGVIFSVLIAIFLIIGLQIVPPVQIRAAGATSNVHIVKYAADGTTVLAEKTVSYEWMQKMLPVLGDGKTHYYHQGPVFEGDMWDPGKTLNLKDKGAVKGTAVKDLCDLVGGMTSGDEASMVAVDGWHTEFAYTNIYEPIERQGTIALCWYNAEDALEGEISGVGYPGNNAYRTALQLVIMATTANAGGKYVFGNSDMQIAFPQEKYQHFYDGQYPSTNGLSGKWIAEIRIYSGGIPSGLKINFSTANYPPEQASDTIESSGSIPWVPIAVGILGVLVVAFGVFVFTSLRRVNPKIGAVLLVGLLLVALSVLLGVRSCEKSPADSPIDANWKLTLAGIDGQLKLLSLKEIQAFPSYTGRGGFFTTVGVINGPFEAKGVPLTDLCQLVGGIKPEDGLMITASDGYSTVFDFDQVNGNFVTYDLKTLKEIPRGEVKVVLMYRQDGKALSQNDGRPLRVAIVGPDNVLTEGNNWVRWVNKIEVLKLQKTP